MEGGAGYSVNPKSEVGGNDSYDATSGTGSMVYIGGSKNNFTPIIIGAVAIAFLFLWRRK